MSIYMLAIFWIISLVIVFFLSFLADYMSKNHDGSGYYVQVSSAFSKYKLNLFSTGIAYLIGNAFCAGSSMSSIRWLIFFVGIAACAAPAMSLLPVIKDAVTIKNKYVTLGMLASLINAIVPLFMAINIYMVYLK